MKGNILVFGNPDSNLAIERSRIPADAGYNVYWFCWWRPQTHKLQKAHWLSGVISPPTFRHGGRPAAALALYYVFLRLQPCIAHVHYALWSAPQAYWMGRLHPLVITAMGSDIMADCGYQGDLAEPTRFLLDHADVITSKSSFMDQTLLGIGPYRNKIRRITWGVDTRLFSPGLDVAALRRRLRISEEDVVFFCARMCVALANKDCVLKAFAQCLPMTNRPLKLIVSQYLGDPHICEQLTRLAHDLETEDSVRFVSEIPFLEMPMYFSLADAVISVPRSDGMPQTLYQAMACGTYPIISDIPHTRELLDMKCELSLAHVNDVNSLAGEMNWVAEHTTEARERGLRNRERILPIANKEQQDRALVAIYDSLLPSTWGRRLRI